MRISDWSSDVCSSDLPSSLAGPVIDQLREFGETRRGWLGVRIQTVTDEIAESLGLDDERGALVASITPGGPAEKAGIEPGDVILSFDGKRVDRKRRMPRSEKHKTEHQSLMRLSYAVFSLQK